jgi:dTDP-4-dehydrorhamnose reductase
MVDWLAGDCNPVNAVVEAARDMRCLITGATGFLGREVVRCFSRAHETVGVGRERGGPDILKTDLRDESAWRGVLVRIRPDLVIHCAAYRDPDFCEDHPEETRRLNVDPVRVLAETLPSSARLVLISTDYVFDGEHPPYREESPRRPLNVYGRSKADAEDLVLARAHSLVLRIPLLAGAGANLASSGFIAQLIQPLQTLQPMELDDVLIRVPTWTRDVAEALVFLADRGAEGVFHMSALRGLTRYGWTVEIARRLGKPTDHLKPSRDVVARKAARPRDATLSTAKLRSMGYNRFTDFPDVVRHVLSSLGVSP